MSRVRAGHAPVPTPLDPLALASFLLFCIPPHSDLGPQAANRSPTTGIRIHGCPHSGHPSWAVSCSAGYSVDGTGHSLTRKAEEGVMVLRPVRPERKPDQGVGHPFPQPHCTRPQRLWWHHPHSQARDCVTSTAPHMPGRSNKHQPPVRL